MFRALRQSHSTYYNNYTIIRYYRVQTCDSPPNVLAFFGHFQRGTQKYNHCTFICRVPPSKYPKKTEICRTTTTCLYNIVPNHRAVVVIYTVKRLDCFSSEQDKWFWHIKVHKIYILKQKNFLLWHLVVPWHFTSPTTTAAASGLWDFDRF